MSDPMVATEPAVVAVAGSCATRDNFNSRFNPHYRRHFDCPLHQNQTSMIALMAPPMDVEWSPTGEMSDYDRWNVDTEFSRSFLENVVELQPAYLIVDFFADVHFGFLRVRGDGDTPPNVVTNNRWKVTRTDWFAAASERGDLEAVRPLKDPEAYLEEWRPAFDRFAGFVRARLPHTQLIVHKAPNVSTVRLPDRTVPAPLQKNARIQKLNVPRANELWRRFDDYAVASTGARTIDLNDVTWSTWPDHPWGPFYVHYDVAYYHRFLAELLAIHVDSAGTDDQRSLLEVTNAAWREQSDLARGDMEAQIARLRRRLAKLEEVPADNETRGGGVGWRDRLTRGRRP